MGSENACVAGSPEKPVEVNGKTVKVGQCNNFWIFPGVGFGAVMSKSKKVTVGSHKIHSYIYHKLASSDD